MHITMQPPGLALHGNASGVHGLGVEVTFIIK